MNKIKRFFVIVWPYVILGFYFVSVFVSNAAGRVKEFLSSMFSRKRKTKDELVVEPKNNQRHGELTILRGASNCVLGKKCENGNGGHEGYLAFKVLAIGKTVNDFKVGDIVLVYDAG